MEVAEGVHVPVGGRVEESVLLHDAEGVAEAERPAVKVTVPEEGLREGEGGECVREAVPECRDEVVGVPDAVAEAVVVTLGDGVADHALERERVADVEREGVRLAEGAQERVWEAERVQLGVRVEVQVCDGVQAREAEGEPVSVRVWVEVRGCDAVVVGLAVPEAARVPEVVAVGLRERDLDPEADKLRDTLALDVSEADREVLVVGARVTDTVAEAVAEAEAESTLVQVGVAEALRLTDGVAACDGDRDREPLPVAVAVAVCDGDGVTRRLTLGEGLVLQDGVLSVGVGVRLWHREREGVAVVVGGAEHVVEGLRLVERDGLRACDAVGVRLRVAEAVLVCRGLTVGVWEAERLREVDLEAEPVRVQVAVLEAVGLGLGVRVAAGVALPGDRVALQEAVEAVGEGLREREPESDVVRVAAAVVVAVREREQEREEGVSEAEGVCVAVGVAREALGEAVVGDREKLRVPVGVGERVKAGDAVRVSEALRGQVALGEAVQEAVGVGVASGLEVPVGLPDGEGLEVRVEAVGESVRVSVEPEAEGVGLRERGEAVGEAEGERVAVDCETVLLPVGVRDGERVWEAESEAEDVPQREAECVAVGEGLGVGLGVAERLGVGDEEREVAVADRVWVLRVREADRDAVDGLRDAEWVWDGEGLEERDWLWLGLPDTVWVCVGRALAVPLGLRLVESEGELQDGVREAERLAVGLGVQEVAVAVAVREALEDRVDGEKVRLRVRVAEAVPVGLRDGESEALALALGVRRWLGDGDSVGERVRVADGVGV